MRLYVEAVLMGLCVGLAAIGLNQWLSDSNIQTRLLALLVVGAALCLLQYGLGRLRRRR